MYNQTNRRSIVMGWRSIGKETNMEYVSNDIRGKFVLVNDYINCDNS